MRLTLFRQRRGRLALLVIAAGVIALALTTGALAVFPEDSVTHFTGCLNTSASPGGTFVNVVQGENPSKPCGKGQILAHLSGGDITAVRTPAGSGLTGGTESGAATLSLSGGQVLPQTCAGGQVPKWNGTIWACGNDIDTDTNTTYSAGQGLFLDEENLTTFNLLPSYQLPQNCDSGQVAKATAFNGWSCQNDATGAATDPAYHVVANDFVLIGEFHRETKTVTSQTIPAGKWALHADLQVHNGDNDFQDYSCTLTGATFNGGRVNQGVWFDFLSAFETHTLPLATTVTLAAPTTISVECNGFDMVVSGYMDALAVQ